MSTPAMPRRRDLRRWEASRRPKLRRTRRVLRRALLASFVAAAIVVGVGFVGTLPGTGRLTTAVAVRGLEARRAAEHASRGSGRTPVDERTGTPTDVTARPGTTTASAAVTGTASAPAGRATGTTSRAADRHTGSPAAPESSTATAPTTSPATSRAADAPAAAATPSATEVPATVAFAASIVTLTDDERREAGLAGLEVSDCATTLAVRRAERLVADGRFEHDPLDEIVDECGTGFVGENLALGYSTPEATVAGWMASEGHRANILRAGYREIGVGCAESRSGMLCAQVFLG